MTSRVQMKIIQQELKLSVFGCVISSIIKVLAYTVVIGYYTPKLKGQTSQLFPAIGHEIFPSIAIPK